MTRKASTVDVLTNPSVSVFDAERILEEYLDGQLARISAYG
jgi:hypothetical protein